jgi:hypothetical protein
LGSAQLSSFYQRGEKSMSMARASLYRPTLVALLIMAMIALGDRHLVFADTLVTGKYHPSSGNEVVLNLSILNPAPASLIVEQYLSPENTIVGTAPPAKKVDSVQGSVKWLFKNTRSGNLSLTIRLASPFVGNVSAIVRYRAPHGGAFTELRITP